MSHSERFLRDARPAKLGTIPAIVVVHGADRVEVGRRVRIKERDGDRWHKVLVTQLGPGDHFFADR
ncbi:MAG TPA: hypothetical protein VM347_44385 [Nonomuraea sp.]|nr:hypothetical protein [Nonomuraea sp.]